METSHIDDRHEATPENETAIFAGGCFWCVEAVFKEIDGVLSVEPGYIGGHTANPDYRSVCEGGTGHAEAIRIRFDPQRVAYRDLLEIFFATHDPTTPNRQGNDVGTQYRSAIFATTGQQEQEAREVIAELSGRKVFPAPIVTEVLPADTFWLAESYHHDYFAGNREQPYCQYVIVPKLDKLRSRFARWLKQNG